MMSADVIVVGAGAAGGWAVKKLTERGLRTLLLEAGERPRLDEIAAFQHDAGRGLAAAAAAEPDPRQPVQSTCFAWDEPTRSYFVDDLEHPYSTPEDRPFRWIRTRAVGGRTTLWRRVVPRMSDAQFAPAWPFRYADLEPFYEEVEAAFGLDGADRGRPLTADEEAFKAAVEARWPERPLRLAPQVPAADEGRPPHFCTAASFIPRAERSGRLELRTGAVVTRVDFDTATGRAGTVRYLDTATRAEHRAHARAVVLCASTLESTRILLSSACDAMPGGLGNGSGALGRYLMDHLFGVWAVGVHPRRRLPLPAAEAGLRLVVPWPDEDAGGGYGVQIRVGHALGRHRGVGCLLVPFGEVLPRYESHVRLDPALTDGLGVPALHVDCRYGGRERAMARHQARTLRELLHAAGYGVVAAGDEPAPPGSSIHEAGTARMGADPKTSVLDPFNRCWEVPNLYVTDGACFPTSGYQNPALTIMAITGRACDHLADQLERGEL